MRGDFTDRTVAHVLACVPDRERRPIAFRRRSEIDRSVIIGGLNDLRRPTDSAHVSVGSDEPKEQFGFGPSRGNYGRNRPFHSPTARSGTRHRDGGKDPTESLSLTQPKIRRPTGACNTNHIVPPSRIWAAGADSEGVHTNGCPRSGPLSELGSVPSTECDDREHDTGGGCHGVTRGKTWRHPLGRAAE